jgi:hypothetical protein
MNNKMTLTARTTHDRTINGFRLSLSSFLLLTPELRISFWRSKLHAMLGNYDDHMFPSRLIFLAIVSVEMTLAHVVTSPCTSGVYREWKQFKETSGETQNPPETLLFDEKIFLVFPKTHRTDLVYTCESTHEPSSFTVFLGSWNFMPFGLFFIGCNM